MIFAVQTDPRFIGMQHRPFEQLPFCFFLIGQEQSEALALEIGQATGGNAVPGKVFDKFTTAGIRELLVILQIGTERFYIVPVLCRLYKSFRKVGLVFPAAMPTGLFDPSVLGHEHLYRGQIKDLACIEPLGFLRQSVTTTVALGNIVQDYLIGRTGHFQFFPFVALLSAGLALGPTAQALGLSKGSWDGGMLLLPLFFGFSYFSNLTSSSNTRSLSSLFSSLSSLTSSSTCINSCLPSKTKVSNKIGSKQLSGKFIGQRLLHSFQRGQAIAVIFSFGAFQP